MTTFSYENLTEISQRRFYALRTFLGHEFESRPLDPDVFSVASIMSKCDVHKNLSSGPRRKVNSSGGQTAFYCVATSSLRANGYQTE